MATTEAAAKKSAKKAAKKSVKKSSTPPSRRWSGKVDTDSTHPDQGLFLKSANTIAKALMTKKVSPKGSASGMQMLNFYINRAGKNLPKERVAELEKAKTILSGMIAKENGEAAPKKASVKSATTRAAAKKAVAKKTTAKKSSKSS